MIASTAKLSIQRIELCHIQIKEYQIRYPSRLQHYVDLLLTHPDSYAGLLSVVPSNTHPGLFVLLDGHHRYCASILAGRTDVLCVVVEE